MHEIMTLQVMKKALDSAFPARLSNQNHGRKELPRRMNEDTARPLSLWKKFSAGGYV